MRKVCLSYLLMLGVVVLFIGNPLKYLGDYPRFVGLYHAIEPGLHVGLFAILAFLVAASHWRLHPAIQVSLLVVFAASSEFVQFLLPNRVPRLFCFIQDLGGLMLGAAAWGFVLLATRNWRHSGSSRQRRKPPIRLEPAPVRRKANDVRAARTSMDSDAS